MVSSILPKNKRNALRILLRIFCFFLTNVGGLRSTMTYDHQVGTSQILMVFAQLIWPVPIVPLATSFVAREGVFPDFVVLFDSCIMNL